MTIIRNLTQQGFIGVAMAISTVQFKPQLDYNSIYYFSLDCGQLLFIYRNVLVFVNDHYYHQTVDKIYGNIFMVF